MPHTVQESRSSRLLRLGVDLRPGEGAVCCLLFAIHFLLLAFQYTSKAVRQATYNNDWGAEQLPFVYLLIAVVSYPVLRVYGYLATRFELHRLIAGSAVLAAATLIVFWWLFGLGSRWVSAAFYVWVSIVGILLVSQFWAYAIHRLNPRQAKRLFGFVGAGGLLGSIAGGQVTRLTSQFSHTRDALLLASVVLLVLAVLVWWKADAASQDVSGIHTAPQRVREAKGGWAIVRGSRYLQLIAVVMLISSMVAQVIDVQFSWAIQQSTTSLQERTVAFGNLFSIMGLSAFIFQMAFTSRIHKWLGIGFALRVLPLSNGVGTILFALAAITMPSLVLPAVWLLKIGENGLRYSLDQATRELLFQPVPGHQRPQAKAFIDVFVQRLAKGAAAVVLLSVSFHWISVENTVWFSLVGVVVWLTLLTAMQRRYVTSFRDALQTRRLEDDQALDIADARTLEVLIEGIGSSDSREVLHSMDLLKANGRGRLVSPMMLYHSDPEVRCKTLGILRDEKRTDTAALVEKLLVDPDPRVRATATLALVALTPQDIQHLMLAHLRDPDVRVRSVAVSYLARQGEGEVRQRAEETLLEMLADGDALVRQEAARAIGAMEEPLHFAGLIQLLDDKEHEVVRAALGAVQRRTVAGGTNPLYAPKMISLLRNRRLKHDARNAIVACGAPVVPQLQYFLNNVEEEIWVRRALPKTIAAIGGRAALEALIESLQATDLFLRRKVISALVRVHGAHPELAIDRAVIEDQLAAESHAYLRTLIDLWSLNHGRGFRLRGTQVVWQKSADPHLLERLLSDRMDDHVNNMFGILALVHKRRDIRAALRGLWSEATRQRATALEFLDNVLTGEDKRLVFAVIDEVPMSDRLRQAKRMFELSPADPATTLKRLTQAPSVGDDDGAWVTATALHYIHDHQLASLYPMIHRAAEHGAREPLVQETTALLLSRIADSKAHTATVVARPVGRHEAS
jgi:AAA family ATP:ADP antiporter